MNKCFRIFTLTFQGNMNVEKDLFCLGMEKMVGLGNQENGIRRKEVVEDLIFSTQLQEERTSGLGDIGADAWTTYTYYFELLSPCVRQFSFKHIFYLSSIDSRTRSSSNLYITKIIKLISLSLARKKLIWLSDFVRNPS